MASQEQVLHFFDFYWFEHEIFASKTNKSIPKTTTTRSSILEVQEDQPEEKSANLSRTPTIVRSFSEECLSSKNDDFHQEERSDSPKSVLVSKHLRVELPSVIRFPKLQPILSGKEVKDFSEPSPRNEAIEVAINGEERDRGTMTRNARRRRRKGDSKSLSELEFEELKGFMDLGFVFSDEDKSDSSLVSIIPGLQRIGKEVFDDESGVSRPYLSEAWEVLEEKRKVKDPLVNWRIPNFGNEMELKDHLRFWAHSVASAVR